jgi:uncharacterized protein YndB with AHSA1/START domain
MHLPAILVALLSSPVLQAPAPPAPAEPPSTEPLVRERVIEAPVEELWRVFSTGAGFTKLGPAQAEVDLRIGGRIRTHYDPQGVLGDEGTIENEILAFEAPRMIAFRIAKAPKGFPFPEAKGSTWTVVTLTDVGAGRTHARIAMLGWSADAESQAMRAFFASGNEWTLRKLASAWDPSAAPKAEARAHAVDPLAPVELEAVVAATRSDVWRAWTTAGGWKDFFGAEARIGARPLEALEILFFPSAPAGQRGVEDCRVLSFVPEEMFSFTWSAPPKFPRARAERTWVVVELESLAPATTRLRLRHLGFAEQAAAHPGDAKEWQEVRAYFTSAWPRVLGALTERFAAPAPAPAR